MSKPPTPTSIVSASILMFIYGGLLMFCGACSSAAAMFQDEKALAMQAEIQKEAPGLMAVSIGTNTSYFLIGILFIVSGLGVLRLVKFFRATAYLACTAILLVTIASIVYTSLYVFPIQQRLMMQELQKNNPPMPFDMNMVMAASLAFGLLIAIAIPLLFCVPTVILLNVKSARDAFAGIEAEPAEDDPYAIRRKPRDFNDEEEEYDDDNKPSQQPRSPGDTGITDKGP